MTDNSTDPYCLSAPHRKEGDELIFTGLDGNGEIAFKAADVTISGEGVSVPPDARPRLLTPPTKGIDTVEEVSGFYCICIGEACYTYQCSDNKYMGQCGPVPCYYYGCS